jgi:hypothetical protein
MNVHNSSVYYRIPNVRMWPSAKWSGWAVQERTWFRLSCDGIWKLVSWVSWQIWTRCLLVFVIDPPSYSFKSAESIHSLPWCHDKIVWGSGLLSHWLPMGQERRGRNFSTHPPSKKLLQMSNNSFVIARKSTSSFAGEESHTDYIACI